MTTPPPLLKPRHADGRLMTEDEIRGLKGNALRQIVGVCVMGARWRWWNGDGRWFLEPREAIENLDGLDRPYVDRPSFLQPQDDKPISTAYVPDWPNDIAAAFTVDRPEWRWEMEDYDHDHFDVMVADRAAAKSVIYEQHLGRKATPADYARARCVAALLLAAKIGE